MGTGPVVGCTGVIHDEIDCIRAGIPDSEKCLPCATAVSRSLRALVRKWRIEAAAARAYADAMDAEGNALDKVIAEKFPQLAARATP